MICGAWGGRPDKDGLEAVTNASQNLSNMPVEVMEAEHPVRIEDYAFVPDSCGAGKWRGGVGIRRSYRILADEALLQLRTDRVAFRPTALTAASPAARRAISSRSAASAVRCRARSPMAVRKGTLIIHEQAGAGGFGDPLMRDPARVREDLRDGKITAGLRRASIMRCVGERCHRSTRARPHACEPSANVPPGVASWTLSVVPAADPRAAQSQAEPRARFWRRPGSSSSPHGLNGARVDRIAEQSRRQQKPDLSLFRL